MSKWERLFWVTLGYGIAEFLIYCFDGYTGSMAFKTWYDMVLGALGYALWYRHG